MTNGMILTDIDIIKKLYDTNPDTRIIITPIINIKEQLDGCALDIRLGTEFILFEKNIFTYMDPLKELNDWEIEKTFRRTKRVNPLKPFVLHPGEQILGSTLEYIRLPNNIFGLLSGRSSWSRQGLAVHSTAEFLHPNTRGSVTFELQNNGPVPIKLYSGMRIAQICFFELNRDYINKSCWKEPRYINNFRPEFGRIWDDREFVKIRSMKNNIVMSKLRDIVSSSEIDIEIKEKLIRDLERALPDVLFSEEK